MKPFVCCFSWKRVELKRFRVNLFGGSRRAYIVQPTRKETLIPVAQKMLSNCAAHECTESCIGHPLRFKGFLIWLVLSSCFFFVIESTWCSIMPTCDPPPPLLSIASTCINRLWSLFSLSPLLFYFHLPSTLYIHALDRQSTRSRIDIRTRESRRTPKETRPSCDWWWIAACKAWVQAESQSPAVDIFKFCNLLWMLFCAEWATAGKVWSVYHHHDSMYRC